MSMSIYIYILYIYIYVRMSLNKRAYGDAMREIMADVYVHFAAEVSGSCS